MDNEIINNNQTTKHSPQIPDATKQETRLSSSTETIDKDQLITGTKVSPSEADMDNNNHKHQNSNDQTAVQGYDPNRIPASIFTSNSKPGTPMEWSVASNESLFSIHLGNNSFSGDHVFMLYRSGEFPKFEYDQATIPMDSNERKSEASSYNSKLMSEEPELAKLNASDVLLDADEPRMSSSSIQSFQFPLLEIGGKSIKEAEKLESPKCGGLNEQQKKETIANAKTEPKHRTTPTPPKRPTWLSFFACCSAAH